MKIVNDDAGQVFSLLTLNTSHTLLGVKTAEFEQVKQAGIGLSLVNVNVPKNISDSKYVLTKLKKYFRKMFSV